MTDDEMGCRKDRAAPIDEFREWADEAEVESLTARARYIQIAHMGWTTACQCSDCVVERVLKKLDGKPDSRLADALDDLNLHLMAVHHRNKG